MPTKPHGTRPETIAGLRALADFLERSPDIFLGHVTTNVFVSTASELADLARGRGPFTKLYAGDWFALQKDFGGNVTLELNAERDKVCRKIITQETVTRPKVIQTGETETVQVDRVSWECGGSILAAGDTLRIPDAQDCQA